MKSLVLVAVVCALATTEARAGWTRVIMRYGPTSNVSIPDPGISGQASSASLRTTTVYATGFASSEDFSWFGGSPQNQVVGSGYLYESFKHVSPGVGEVELVKNVEIEGLATVRSHAAGAGAFGYAKADHRFDGMTYSLMVELRRSSSETSSGALGSVSASYGGVGFQIDVDVYGRGAGAFPDGSGPTFGSGIKCPVVFYEHDLRASLALTTFANKSFFSFGSASGKAEGMAVAGISFNLLTHPTCP
jgi:hypothetical protein